MSIRDKLIHLLSGLTYRDRTALVPGRLHRRWPEQQTLRRLLARLGIDCVLDVGANVGQYASELRRIGYRGAIVSFEPIPECYQKLAEQGKADPGWTGYNVALADRTSQRSFNVMKSSDFSSFRQPSGISSLHFPEENLVDRVLDIETTTLNQVIPELGGSRYFLKMDTQGYDLEVFRGSDAVRDSISGLQTEVSLVHIYENVPAWHEAIQEYREAGYGLVAMHPLQHDEYKEAVEINCYFSRL